ncbi:hypothetical protein SAMN05216404_10893 [Nitrosospira multiformis]|uniref:Uncharacterized protein n=1 Tax=Nitrosospira multiformis TaxID=1231 RepID=A0A1H8KCD8_9PROT|nr:hypothetical protein SAMN05216404_10893 [Nitrosospira multiformis]
MILLGTVVLSELRKRDTSPQVIRWLKGYQDTDLFLSVVSIGESNAASKRNEPPTPRSPHYSRDGLKIYCFSTATAYYRLHPL